MKKFILVIAMFSFYFSVAQKTVKLISEPNNNKVMVIVDGKAFTNYYYPGKDVLKKAVLYPVISPNGTIVSRGWPLDPRKGERVDHPHHVGIWLNYEDANGHDFWNNSIEIEKENTGRTFGTIVHKEIKVVKSGRKKGKLVVTADWLDKNGAKMLEETTEFVFSGDGISNIVDRKTILKSVVDEVIFKDVKDGFFAIRVARELELPSNKAEIYTDASGKSTSVAILNNEGVNGNYINAEGITGEATWGKRSKWVSLQGNIENENVSVSIFDHPKNVGYPSYWHTRGYGLFSVNPLGRNVFTNGKESLNLTLKNGQEVGFRYRLAVSSKKLDNIEINKLADDFSKKY